MTSLQATKDPHFKKVLCNVIEYVSRDLRHSEGGFYSAEDADSLPTHDSNHKKEGAFCVWTDKELQEIIQGMHVLPLIGTHKMHVIYIARAPKCPGFSISDPLD